MTIQRMKNLEAFFNPASVAVIGVSSDMTKFTGRTLKYLIKHGYPGRIYPINPKYQEISGIPCFGSVRDLPEVPDMAFVQIPARLTLDAVRQCAERGVRAVLLHTAGMGETSEEGKRAEQELLALAHASGMVICGPNSGGMVNLVDRVVLTPVVAMELDDLKPGKVGLVSQSGGMTGALITRAYSRGIGFSHVVSTGNEMDLKCSDYVRFMLEDPHTSAVAIFMEGLRDTDIQPFLKAARTAMEKGKPIVVLKVGKAEVGRKAAASHTGALTGSDEVYSAMFRQMGVVRVHALEELFETASMFSKTPLPAGDRVGVLTTTGGGALLLADEGGSLGLKFPSPKADTARTEALGLPSFASTANPLDVTMSGVGDGFRKSLRLFLEDENFDIVVAVVGTSAQFYPELGVRPVLEAAGSDRPLLAYLNPLADEAARLLEAGGVPAFRTPESCAHALRALVHHARFVGKHAQRKRALPGLSADTDKARGILGSAGQHLTENQSKQLLSLYGIPVIQEKVAHTTREAAEQAEVLGFPVALKVLSPSILHKSEAGAIRLNLSSCVEVRKSYGEILEAVRSHDPEAEIQGVLVQKMAQEGLEVIAGISRDPQFGPVLVFGLGGILVEVLRDVSMRLAPIGPTDAEEMLDEIRSAALLRGFRGLPAADRGAIVDVLLRLSQLAGDLGDEIEAVDINPLMVYPEGEGAVAVDALVIKRKGE
ncbi:MAG: acetate--CoA ligase family protein [Deltaproteobacteria bacterium]|nr:acetate--CoA ligase family protein [Deltaproteobacteria bacterium]